MTAYECKRCPKRRELREYFDRVVVINLARRVDRLEAFEHELTEKGWPFKRPEVFSAVDGAKVCAPKGFVSGDGAWGCVRSHVAVLERALNDGVKSLLVLEDDAALRYSFADDVARFLSRAPDDWEQLMLGGQFVGRDRSLVKDRVSDGVLRVAGVERTHAYAVRGRYMQDLYALWCRADRHCDHVMGPFQRGRLVYAPDPFVVGQARSKSDINGKVNAPNFWSPPSGDEEVWVLRCEKEQLAAFREAGVHTGYRRDAETDVDVGLVGRLDDRKLSRWIHDLQGEVNSGAGKVLGIYKPGIDVEQVQRCWRGQIREVTP